MARPKAEPYTLGSIKVVPHPTAARNGKKNKRGVEGPFQARGSYNDSRGKLRTATASGDTEAAAERALKAKVVKAKDEWRGGDAELRYDTPLVKAAQVWLDWKMRERLAESTMRDYRGYVKNSIDVGLLANFTVLEANDVGRIENWLKDIADSRGATAADQSRKVLSQILQLAERRGAIPASILHRAKTPKPAPGSAGDRKCKDDECDYDCGKQHLDTRRAFTLDEAIRVQEESDAAVADIGDLVAFLFNTGVRISEALHCTSWADVDLDQRVVRVRGTKTAHADRVLEISPDVVDRLRMRAAVDGRVGLVFGITRYHSKLGKPKNRENVAKALRRALDRAGANWAGSHTFRRTVASWLDADGASLAEIANQLGHGDTNVTAKYLGRRTQPTRAASVMVLPKRDGGRLRAV